MNKDALDQIKALREDRRNLPVALHVFSTLAIIGLAIAALWFTKEWTRLGSNFWFVWVAAFLIIGLMQYRMVMAVHEATHKNLFFPAAVNETVGKILCGFLGMNLGMYRKSHLQHHKSPQKIGEDVDAPLYSPPMRVAPGFTRFWALLTGVVDSLFRKIIRKFSKQPEFAGKKIEVERDWLQLLLILVAQVAMFALFATQIVWWAYFTHWLAPLVLIAQLMDELRIFVEHGYNYFQTTNPAPIDELQQSTIDVETNFLERYLFAPYGFDMHLAHHAQLTVPFYNLKKLSRILQENDPNYGKPIKRSYLGILWEMINAVPQVAHPGGGKRGE
mgnify:CR=1 FL=1